MITINLNTRELDFIRAALEYFGECTDNGILTRNYQEKRFTHKDMADLGVKIYDTEKESELRTVLKKHGMI